MADRTLDTDAEPVLAVVLIARNEEAYVGRAIAAVLAATAPLGPCDVVLVDSHSDDRTVEIAATHPIRIVELSPAQRLSPAMGRHVGARVTRGRYVLFVDGDSEIEPGWVPAAMALLDGRPAVAAVAGREDQVYYCGGRVVGGKADYFGTGDAEREVEQLGGNGMYRRTALEAVGSFNPWVRSFEEAELGARLRRAGWRIVRTPGLMARHHTPPPDAVDEYWRRLRGSLLTGQGQVLRLALRDGLFWEHARRLNRPLLFSLWTAAGVAALAVAAFGARAALVAWLVASGVLLAAFVVRSRSLARPCRMIFDWAVSSPPLLWGFCLTPRGPEELRLDDAVAAERAPGGRPAAPARRAG